MTLPEIAKKAVEIFIREREIISLENIPEQFLNKKAGVFVTIEKNVAVSSSEHRQRRDLRGCIGTYLPTRKNIAEETILNAVAAATEDWRFGPVSKEELPALSYIVYVLGKPEPVDSVRNLDPKKYGVIVSTQPAVSPNDKNVFFNGRRSPKTGVLLPDLEEIDTAEKQLFAACQKSEIDLSREKIAIYRFTVQKYF